MDKSKAEVQFQNLYFFEGQVLRRVTGQRKSETTGQTDSLNRVSFRSLNFNLDCSASPRRGNLYFSLSATLLLFCYYRNSPFESSKPLYQIARTTSLRFVTSRDANLLLMFTKSSTNATKYWKY